MPSKIIPFLSLLIAFFVAIPNLHAKSTIDSTSNRSETIDYDSTDFRMFYIDLAGDAYNPQMDVTYTLDWGADWTRDDDSHTYEIGECNALHTIRFCMRYTEWGKHGNNSDRYGSNSDGYKKDKLCLFHDNVDITDSDWDFSPWHKGTSEEEAKELRDTYDSINFGPIISWIDDANYDVYGIVGCVVPPLAPGPPPFCHDCDSLTPPQSPTIVLATSSTWENPKITISREGQSITLGPDENGSFSTPPGTFEAYINTSNSLEICATEDINYYGKAITDEIGCVKRDPMPRPLNITLTGTGANDNGISFDFGSTTNINLLADISSSDNCETHFYHELCAVRPCILGPTDGECIEDNYLCIEGYAHDTLIVAEQNNNGIPGKAVEGSPNSSIANPYPEELPWYYDQNTSIYYDSSTKELRPKTAKELGLCVELPGGIYAEPGDYQHVVEDSCDEVLVQIWGAGAAGDVDDNILNINQIAGASGGFISLNIDMSPYSGDDRIIDITVGSGGTEAGENGQASTIEIQPASPTEQSPTLSAFAGGGENNLSWGNSIGGDFLCPTNASTVSNCNGVNGINTTDTSVNTCSSSSGAAPYDPVLESHNTDNAQNAEACNTNSSSTSLTAVNRAPNSSGGCAKSCITDNSYGLGGHGMVIIQCTSP